MTTKSKIVKVGHKLSKDAKYTIIVMLIGITVEFGANFINNNNHKTSITTKIDEYKHKVDSALLINECSHKSFCNKFDKQDTVNIGVENCFFSQGKNLNEYMPNRDNKCEKIRVNNPNEE